MYLNRFKIRLVKPREVLNVLMLYEKRLRKGFKRVLICMHGLKTSKKIEV